MRAVLEHFHRYSLTLLLLVGLPGSFAWGDVPGLKPAEYMVYQYPYVSLVIVIDVREAEFGARVEGTEGALIGESGLPGRRIGPLYHFVEAVDKPRQLMIEVTPSRRVDRSHISMQLLQLADSDRNGVRLTRAYRFLAHGMKRVPDGESAAWFDRIYSLRNASQAFAALGMEEMSLWAAHYAAHLALHGLGDAPIALEGARTVMASAQRAGFTMLEFVSGVLEAEALMAGLGEDTNRVDEGRLEDARQRWKWAAGRADMLGYRVEHVRALYQEGRALQLLDKRNEAIDRYEAALAASEGVTDVELLNEIRTTAAAAYESSGSTSGAIELLAGLTTDIAAGETSAEQELARNLYEKGRLLNSTGQHVSAAADLQRSIDLQLADPDRPEWGLAGLELGKAQYALGEPDAAEAMIRRALARTPHSEERALADGWGLLARIARERGDFDSVSGSRERQGALLNDDANRAAFLLERGLDAMSQHGPGSNEASGLFREARRSAAGSDVLSGHRAALYACLVDLQARGRSGCDLDSVRDDHDALRRSGVPEISVESGLAWARVLDAAGQGAAARAEAERLMDSVQFYRERLPGMISAWHAYHRDELYGVYAQLAGRSSPEALLLALLRVRDLERSRPGENGGDGELRSQVARVVSAQPTPDDALSRQAYRELRVFRENAGWSSGALSRSDLRDILGRLDGDDTLLTYRFSDDDIEAIFARRLGIEVMSIRGAGHVRSQIDSLRQSLAAGFVNSEEAIALLDDLGTRLLAPLGGNPVDRIYLLPSGPLNGIPFDALRVEDRFLAERSEVVNLDSLEYLRIGPSRLDADQDVTVFLAGNPRSGRDLFSYGVSTSQEIGAVRDRFVGDGLHIVQGVALRDDEFDDERYASASIIHLAMPGRVDLSVPERSRLLLSGERETPEAEFLSSGRLRVNGVEAVLAVLSGTTFSGRPANGYDSRIGLVSDLQQAGADLVLASLWPAGDEENARFMTDFYGALERDGDMLGALRGARLSRIGGKNDTNLRNWAGFQLFIR